LHSLRKGAKNESGTSSATNRASRPIGRLTTATHGRARNLAYTTFNLPDSSSGIRGAGGLPRYRWWYDDRLQRLRERVDRAGGYSRDTWFFHPDNVGTLAFERDQHSTGESSNRHYLRAGGATFAVLVTSGPLPTLSAAKMAPSPITATAQAVKFEAWHTDHLGSLRATSDHTGTVTARYAYDPYGKRRHTDGRYDPFGDVLGDWTQGTNAGTDRGFTGHEHLDELDLVHMNGRLFHPGIGRFMQADPFIQSPSDLQSLDRYAYCAGAPTHCTDPSGYFLKWLERKLRKEWDRSPLFRQIVGLAVSAWLGPGGGANWAFGVTDKIGTAAVSGFFGGAVATGNLEGALTSALTAAAFSYVGAGTEGMTGGTKIAAHAVTGCFVGEATGGTCGTGALSAAAGKAARIAPWGSGPEIKFVQAVTAGGVASVLGGGKFGNGAWTAGFGYLFNCLATQSGNCGDPNSNNDVAGKAVHGSTEWTLTGQIAGKAGPLGSYAFGPGISFDGILPTDFGFVTDYSLPIRAGGSVHFGGLVQVSALPGNMLSLNGTQSMSFSAALGPLSGNFGLGMQTGPKGGFGGASVTWSPVLNVGAAAQAQVTRTFTVRGVVDWFKSKLGGPQ
jgi:RHS repeat-associated protein